MAIRYLILLAAFVSPLPAIGAQAPTPSEATGRLLHKFEDYGYEQLTAYLDAYALRLRSEPNSAARVVVHRGRGRLPGIAQRYLRTVRNYLVWYGKIVPSRIRLVEGDAATCLSTELWIVPLNAREPPRMDVQGEIYWRGDETVLYDTQGLEYEQSQIVPAEIITDPGLVDGFGQELALAPHTRGVLIGYGSQNHIVVDSRQRVIKFLRERKQYLVSVHKIAPSRITILYGGYRGGREVDLWLVPHGGAQPVAQPTLLPPVRRSSGR